MSRPASSSGVYGLTVAIVGTFDLIRNVGMISNSEATATAIVTHTVKRPACAPTGGASGPASIERRPRAEPALALGEPALGRGGST
jgi:hypothetical protein